MFFLSIDNQSLTDAAHVLYYDEEGIVFNYREILEYLDYIPKHFHQAIRDKTLLNNEKLYNDYRNWCEAVLENDRVTNKRCYENKLQMIENWDDSSRELFSKGFHDGEFLVIEKTDNQLRLILDMSGGFTTASLVELIFHNALVEGDLKGSYVYDEMVKTTNGYALRILSSYGSPYAQATIYFSEVTTKSMYRPLAYYNEALQMIEEYLDALDKDDTYFIMVDKRIKDLSLDEISFIGEKLYFQDYFLGASLREVSGRIYCQTFADRFEIFRIPIEKELLIASVLSGDLVLKSRAFNTFYALGIEVAPYVNELLRMVDPEQTDDILFSLLASHFYELNSLDEDIIQKWRERL